MARTKKRLWGFNHSARDILAAATVGIPSLRWVVARAERRPEYGNLWMVAASTDELDEMYDLVSALMDSTRSQRKLDELDGMLASLSTAMDGF
jgi:hypothetical protein